MTVEERIKDIKEHPEKHRHGDVSGIATCSMNDGALNIAIFQAHQDYVSYGTNGGVKCDVAEGPCSCGGWH